MRLKIDQEIWYGDIPGQVKDIHEDGTVTVRLADGETLTVPAEELEED